MFSKSSPRSARIQIIIFLFAFLVSLAGLLAIYNASVVEAFSQFDDKYHFVSRQLVWLVAGFGLFFALAATPLKLIKKATPYFFAASLFSLALVIIPGLGLQLQGARRWLNLGLFGFQPSEPFKLFLILYLANWLQKPRKLSQFLALIGLIALLLMLQPDLGTTIIIIATSFIIYYLSGAPLSQLLTFSALAAALAGLLIFTSPYRLRRVQTFLDPTSDPLGASYHINQVLLSIGSGGWFGVGIGRSLQKYSYLPEATTDSIFAILAEELGFIGSTIIIILLFAFVGYIFRQALKSKDSFPRLIIAGIAGLLASQIFVNLAAMVALVPLTGVPLPLISYGGSSLLTTLASLGILVSAVKNK